MRFSAEKERELIAGRIIDEYRKHGKLSNWHEIAALKLHRHWDEYYTGLIAEAVNVTVAEMQKEINRLKAEIVRLENENDELN